MMQSDSAYARPLLSASGRIIFPSQERMLYERYGFFCRSEDDALAGKPSTSPHATLEVRTAARRLGVCLPPDRSRGSVIRLLACYNKLVERDQAFPRGPWDTDPGHHLYVACTIRAGYKFKERAYADGSRAFILTANGAIDTRGPVVIVYDPLVVLALYRTARLSDIRNVMGAAVKLGVRFTLARAFPIDSLLIPWRRRNAVFTEAHIYASYVRYRDAFLRSKRGHVAIKAGGLVARLAVGAVGPDDIYNGAMGGVDRKFATFGRFDLFDASLTQRDVSVLCGVHFTPEWSREPSSWWPTPDVWAGCRLDREFWTPEAEDWFIGWREQLEHGGLDRAPTKTEWRARLRPGSAASHQLMDNCRERAYRYLR